MSNWSKWMLGLFSALLVSWAVRTETQLSEVSSILGELKQINIRLERIERALDKEE